MKMKIKTEYILLTLVLCISVFFKPVMVYASGNHDTTPPVVYAAVSDGVLHIEASDPDTGVDAVYVGGKRINYRVDNTIDLEWDEVVKTDMENISIYAVDFAGNQSKTVEIKNPYYEAIPIEQPFTPDGQATVVNHTMNEDGKEFYIFTTPEENVFYLVIDKQRESENVYFLNTVTEKDLIALAEKGKESNTISESAIPEVVICNCTEKCEIGNVNTICLVCKNDLKACTGKVMVPSVTEESEPKQPKKEGSGTWMFVLLAVSVVGGVGYYFKIYKPKHDLDDAEDLEDLLEDELEVNEDIESSDASEIYPSRATEWQETDMDMAIYDDYPDDESD